MEQIKRLKSGSVWLGFIGVFLIVAFSKAGIMSCPTFGDLWHNLVVFFNSPSNVIGTLFIAGGIYSNSTQKGLFDDGTWFKGLITVAQEWLCGKGGNK